MTTRTLVFTSVALLSLALPPCLQAAPFENLPNGRIRHTLSGFIFPAHIGMFQREQMRQYNQAGSDVSAGYNAGALIAATVYVYPAPAQASEDVLKREYASKRAEVIQGHRGVSVLSEGSASVSQGDKKQQGMRAYFSYRDVFARAPQSLKSQLLVFHEGPVFVEYRFTYPRDHAEAAEREIDNFIRAWSWRGRTA